MVPSLHKFLKMPHAMAVFKHPTPTTVFEHVLLRLATSRQVSGAKMTDRKAMLESTNGALMLGRLQPAFQWEESLHSQPQAHDHHDQTSAHLGSSSRCP